MNKQRIANDIYKYLHQKPISFLEIIFLIMGIGGILVLFFATGIGFFGIPFALVGVGGFCVLLSTKIKDDDFDKIMMNIAKNNHIDYEADNTLTCYNCNKGTVKLGKDGNYRSSLYSVTHFDFKKGFCNIIKHEIDGYQETVNTVQKQIPLSSVCNIIFGNTKYGTGYLTFDANEDFVIPVDLKSYDTDLIIEKFKKK